MIAFVTSAKWPSGSADDHLLIPILRKLKIDARHVVWTDPEIAWSSFDAVILRSCWDYHTRMEEFKTWLRTMVRLSVKIFNPADCVLWNTDKTYLKDLSSHGIRIPPTLWVEQGANATLHELMTEQDWDAVVVKPTVSASAFETKLLMLTQAVSSQEWFRQLLSRRNVIVQKFMPEIMSAGEISIIYFNKQYSHAVCKLPQKGDFRVQDELGGSYHSIVPDNRVVKWGRDILERVGHPLLYARVDAVMITREPVLTELELIEPDLYLDTSQGGIDNFVEAIRKWGHIDD